MFKSIVVAFDGSVHASRALEVGATLAAQNQARLGIIYVIDGDNMEISEQVRKMGEIEHIIDPMPKLMVDFKHAPAPMIDSMARAQAESERALYQYADFLLQQAEDSAKQYGAEEVESRSVSGNPAEVIVDYAAERNADLIITGSRGFGKLKRLMLGSTSARVAELAECSCLTIK